MTMVYESVIITARTHYSTNTHTHIWRIHTFSFYFSYFVSLSCPFRTCVSFALPYLSFIFVEQPEFLHTFSTQRKFTRENRRQRITITWVLFTFSVHFSVLLCRRTLLLFDFNGNFANESSSASCWVQLRYIWLLHCVGREQPLVNERLQAKIMER